MMTEASDYGRRMRRPFIAAITNQPKRLAELLGEDTQLLEAAINDWLAVQTHPVFQDGGVQATEVVVRYNVALF